MKTLLLENNGIASKATIDWVNSTDENYVEFNPEVRNYMSSDDLFAFDMFMDPDL